MQQRVFNQKNINNVFLQLNSIVSTVIKKVVVILIPLLVVACGGGGGSGGSSGGGDTTAPVLTLNGAASVLLSIGSIFADSGASAIDDVDGTVTVTTTGSVNTAEAGSYTITYSATDSAGNTSTLTRTVSISDPDSLTITLNGSANLSVDVNSTFADPGATASDDLSSSIAVTTSGSIDTSIPGSQNITYSATGSLGNSVNVIRVVTVVDPNSPVITLNGSASIDLNVGDTYVEQGATAIDNVDPSVTVIISGSVDTSTPGTYTISYSASDSEGNTSVAQRTIVVSDVTAPAITLNGSANIDLDFNDTYIEQGATATDDVDASVTVITSGAVNTAVPGTYIIVYSATDNAGNNATEIRTIEVSDVIAPVITITGDINIALNIGDTYTEQGATATDDVDGTATVTTSGAVNTALPGTYIITYSATDNAGNNSTVDRTIVVSDVTAPVITLTGPANITLGINVPYVEQGATATDDVDDPVTVTISGTVVISALGTYEIHYDATDSSLNNAIRVTRTVMVADITDPVVTLNGASAITITVGDSFSDPGATALDDVNGVLGVAVTGPPVSKLRLRVGTHILTYTATDAAGNIGSNSLTVTVDPLVPTAPLNDTGVTFGGNYPTGENVTCIGETIDEQDCSHGRDALAGTGSLSKAGAGDAGFDFTKLDSNGDLAAGASSWDCVRDNHTGLVWEKKTIGNKDTTYRWGGLTELLTGSFGTSYNDWDALVNSANGGGGLCGFSDWRVPAREDLRSIVNHIDSMPTIDTTYFTNNINDSYWSASAYAPSSLDAWVIDFSDGFDFTETRDTSTTGYVRLVRGGQ